MDNTKKVPVIFGQAGGHPNYKANQSKAVDKRFRSPLGVESCCMYCGKACYEGGTFIYLTALAEVVAEMPKDGEIANDDLGLYAVGSDCAKLFRKAGVKIYNWNCEEV